MADEKLKPQPHVRILNENDERYKTIQRIAERLNFQITKIEEQQIKGKTVLNIHFTYTPGPTSSIEINVFEDYLKEKGFSVRLFPTQAVDLQTKGPQPTTSQETTSPAGVEAFQKRPSPKFSLLPTPPSIYAPPVTIPTDVTINFKPPDFSALGKTELHGEVQMNPTEDYFRKRAYDYTIAEAMFRLQGGKDKKKGINLGIDTQEIKNRENQAIQGFMRDIARNVTLTYTVDNENQDNKTLLEILSSFNNVRDMPDNLKKALKQLLFNNDKKSDDELSTYLSALKSIYDGTNIEDGLTTIKKYNSNVGLIGNLKNAYNEMTNEKHVEEALQQLYTISKVVYLNLEQNIIIAKLVDSSNREIYISIHFNQETGRYDITPIVPQPKEEGGKKLKYYNFGGGLEIRWDESSQVIDGFLYLRGDVALKWIEGLTNEKGITYGEVRGEAGAGVGVKLWEGRIRPFAAIVASSQSAVEPESSIIFLTPDSALSGIFRRVTKNEATLYLGFDLQLLRDLGMAAQLFERFQTQPGLAPQRTIGGSLGLRYQINENLFLTLAGLYAIEKTPFTLIPERGGSFEVQNIRIDGYLLGINGNLSFREDPFTGKKVPTISLKFSLGF